MNKIVSVLLIVVLCLFLLKLVLPFIVGAILSLAYVAGIAACIYIVYKALKW